MDWPSVLEAASRVKLDPSGGSWSRSGPDGTRVWWPDYTLDTIYILDCDTHRHVWCKSIFGKLKSLCKYKTQNGISVVCNFNFATLLQSFRLNRTHWDRMGVERLLVVSCLLCLAPAGTCEVKIQLAQKRVGNYLSICPFYDGILTVLLDTRVYRFPLLSSAIFMPEMSTWCHSVSSCPGHATIPANQRTE